MAPANVVKAAEAGAAIADTAHAPLAFGNSHPAVEMIAAAFQESRFDTGLDLDLLFEISEYWEEVRKRGHYKRGVSSLTHMKVYSHQVPGGMMSNLMSQLEVQKAAERLPEVMAEDPEGPRRGRVSSAGHPALADRRNPGGVQRHHRQALVCDLLEGDEGLHLRLLRQGAGSHGFRTSSRRWRRDSEIRRPRRGSRHARHHHLRGGRRRNRRLGHQRGRRSNVRAVPQRGAHLPTASTARPRRSTSCSSRSQAEPKRRTTWTSTRIRELVKVAEESGVGEIVVEEEGVRIAVRMPGEGAQASVPVAAPAAVAATPAVQEAPAAAQAAQPASERPATWYAVTAPMVGTYYEAPAPRRASVREGRRRGRRRRDAVHRRGHEADERDNRRGDGHRA